MTSSGLVTVAEGPAGIDFLGPVGIGVAFGPVGIDFSPLGPVGIALGPVGIEGIRMGEGCLGIRLEMRS